MNWLTWRQYRAQAIAGYAAVALVVAFFVITGWEILDGISSSGLEHCLARGRSGCDELASSWAQRYNPYQYALPLLLVVPALFGMFWGAPLIARELEQGTHRLVWTQSVTRGRWLVSKLAVILGSAVVASGLLALTITWWISPFVVHGRWVRLSPGVFDVQGIVPIAYTFFAITVGVAFGVLFRKTLPAMFAALAVFGVVRIGIAVFAREHYMAAERYTVPFSDSADLALGPRDWVVSSQIVDASGRTLGGALDFETATALAARCPGLLSADKILDKDAIKECADKIGLVTPVAYHSDERFWIFQNIEAGIFIALAALLIVFVTWRVKRLT